MIRTHRSRSGMTLVELMIALTVFGVVISTTVTFMTRQNTAFQDSIRRLVALRNLRYAATTLAQDLETLGTNVPDGQPSLVYADDDVIVFAADYATNIADDPFSVFYDPDAPTGEVRAPAAGFSIPNSAVSFPDTAYESVPGVRSPAEVIVFYLTPDTNTVRTDDYILVRQVNGATPSTVARHLLRAGTAPFFSYERIADDGAGGHALSTFPDSLLPIHHVSPVHLSPADTGRSALADSVRAVRVRLRAIRGGLGLDEGAVSLDRLIPLPNAGFGMLATCGSPPLLGTGLAAVAATLTTGEPVVNLAWSPAVDEAGGEADVVRYVIWRREVGSPGWGDPFRAVPAGAPAYSYQDAAVTPGASYEYALAAQDCTPTLSALAASPAVIVP